MTIWHRTKQAIRRLWQRLRRRGQPYLLREFIYLDEVSLRSLLTSQTGHLTESSSEERTDIRNFDVGWNIGAELPKAGSASASSNFQTSNSIALQTSRKAIAQSWFRELHQMRALRLLDVVQDVPKLSNASQIRGGNKKAAAIAASELKRGSLIEVKVKLVADPVFRMGTMLREFMSMAEDVPDRFISKEVWKMFGDAGPMNKVLDRLLAGLIPIKAESIDYEVLTLDGKEYVAHKEATKNIAGTRSPLSVVGVTEHIAYWKDIRRVLFSDGEFTMLCRVSRHGLHSTWTPVKLADLFRQMAPDLVSQINAAGESALLPKGATRVSSHVPSSGPTEIALRTYVEALNTEFSPDQSLAPEELDSIIMAHSTAETAVERREAFGAVRLAALGPAPTTYPTPERDLELRENSRQAAGLSEFPWTESSRRNSSQSSPATLDKGRLIDVEVVAIYW